MKSVSTLFPKPTASLSQKRQAIAEALTQCRHQTLQLTTEIDQLTFAQQSHPDFSPIGWHLGHIAFTEAYWILEQLAGSDPQYTHYHQLFAADGLPKAERQNLPNLPTIEQYLNTIRAQTLEYLATAPIETQERLWWWLIQHEAQHGETIAFVKRLHQLNNSQDWLSTIESENISQPVKSAMVLIPQGSFTMGSDAIEAQDNERPAHLVYLDNYYIDVYPVTYHQYQQFIDAAGYDNPQWWSRQGWQWKQTHNISQPLYWSDLPQLQNHPVHGVSYYEAEAYANFVGKRLLTEAEWEKAAQFNNKENGSDFRGNYNSIVGQSTPVNSNLKNSNIWGCYDMLGNVWEWTSSWFAPYETFTSYPYSGYSEVYFDNQHRILKGGSYVTSSFGVRSSFRNWYHPWVRQIFAGFRCAKDNDLLKPMII